MAYGKSYRYTLKFDTDTSVIRQQLQSALNDLSNLAKKSSDITYDKSIREAASAAQLLGKYLYNAFNVDTGKLDLTKFNRSLKEGGMTLLDFANKLSFIEGDGNKAFLNVAMAISKAETPALRLNGILDNLWITMKNTMRWQLTSSALHGFIGTVQTAWYYTLDLNESLNSIRRVTGMGTEEMASFAKEANKAAQALNTTTVDYTDASLIYYQLGLDTEQVKERTRITIDAANAAGTSAEKMSEYLTAVWNSYQVATDLLERYVDKMAAVGASTATSLEEISTAMVNVASTANTVGVNMDQLTAIISTVASTTRQSATTIGTAFKTIFARIGDLSLGETLEDGLDLGTVSSQLHNIGIDILDVNGDLKEMGSVVEEIGEKWLTWTSAQQTAVAQAIAGKRQYTQLIALFDNWDAYQYALGVSEESEGTLARQADIFAESWEASSKRVQAAAEGIYDSLVNDEFWIEFNDGVVFFLNRLEDIIDGMGGMEGIINTTGLLITSLYGDKLAQALRNTASSILELTGALKKSNEELRQSLNSLLEGMGSGTEADLIKQRINLLLDYEKVRGKMSDMQKAEIDAELTILDYLHEKHLLTEATNQALLELIDLLLQSINASHVNNQELLIQRLFPPSAYRTFSHGLFHNQAIS